MGVDWKECVQILPGDKMDAREAGVFWRAVCFHPDHSVDVELTGTHVWQSGVSSAGSVAVALAQHWGAKHGG